MPQPILEFKYITKCYSKKDFSINILDSANFKLFPGEIAMLIGESGIGKTTILHIAALLELPNSGEIWIDSNLCNKENFITLTRRKKIGFIYQFHHLLQEFDVLDNVSMPLLINTDKLKEASDKARSLLEELGLLSMMKSKISEISGGQRQRVAIARAMIHKPKIIIADEPTGNLDEENSKLIFKMMIELARKYQISLLIATHNLSFLSYADSVFTVKNRKLHKM